MSFRRLSFFVVAAGLVACQDKAAGPTRLPTTAVTRGDIAVRVQATGTVEPINPVDIKSKANGQIIQLPAEVGTVVKAGDLLAQVDPRDVKNGFDQAMADDVVSSAGLIKALQDRARKDSLFAKHVITISEHDSTRTTISVAQSDMIESRASLDLARQKLEDATVRAPIPGTVVARPISNGTIITSVTSANGGTTLMTIADLGRVRMRVTIDEVEMANIHVGETATVAVDAFSDRKFEGVIEKIEPQAVVTQGVTFFPVLVSVSNKDGLLMPGMNGEVTIKAADLSKVLQVPIDAIRATNELAPVARMFGVPVDTLENQLRRDLVSSEGTTGIPGRYVIVQLANDSYEMRLIKTGPTDLRVTEVHEGVKEGDKVVMLGAIMTTKPAVPPKLQIAENMKRGAPTTRAAQAKTATPDSPSASGTKTPPAARKAIKP
ncbi:MAG TPA: efflux RND transporter periplasmic adaptor subunit [Gemmatimonadaceae bacterium]|nr:efflux RND transporter periplasmic adaptor subunit [Gemmatimonadaceae bacterium]